MLRVELPQVAHRSEAHDPETEGNGSFIDTIISLLCGIVCKNEQYNKPVGKATSLSAGLFCSVIFRDDYRQTSIISNLAVY